MDLEHSGTMAVYRQESPVEPLRVKQDVVVFCGFTPNLWCCGKFPTFAQFRQDQGEKLSLKLYSPRITPRLVVIPPS